MIIASEIKPTEDGSIQIDLTINNSTPFPILSMTGEFDFGGADVINKKKRHDVVLHNNQFFLF